MQSFTKRSILKARCLYQKLDHLSRRTFFLESIRAGTIGVIDTAQSTFFLLYLERVLSADHISKGIVAGGYFYGLLFSPFIVQISLNRGYRPSTFCSFLFASSALALLTSLLFTNTFSISLLLALCTMLYSTTTPLMTEIYSNNYKSSARGLLFSLSNMIKIIGAFVAGYLIGEHLEVSYGNFHQVFLVYAALLFFNALVFLSYPKTPISEKRGNSLSLGIKALRENKIFRLTLISWMLMGFGNLMLLPLRVEFLANPKFGVSLSASNIALYVVVIPSISRFVFSTVWGVLFDRMNFFIMRILVNMGFIAGVIAFFFTGSSTLLTLGSVLIGFSNAGGDVAWNLWVTKFAPPGQSSTYMSVHTFFTGVRGVLAPLLGFYISATYGFYPIMIISVSLLLLASGILFNKRDHTLNGPTLEI